jgi:translation initiation factor IF-3
VFRGREILHQENAFALLQEIKEAVQEHGITEQEPRLEGRNILMLLTGKKQK